MCTFARFKWLWEWHEWIWADYPWRKKIRILTWRKFPRVLVDLLLPWIFHNTFDSLFRCRIGNSLESYISACTTKRCMHYNIGVMEEHSLQHYFRFYLFHPVLLTYLVLNLWGFKSFLVKWRHFPSCNSGTTNYVRNQPKPNPVRQLTILTLKVFQPTLSSKSKFMKVICKPEQNNFANKVEKGLNFIDFCLFALLMKFWAEWNVTVLH